MSERQLAAVAGPIVEVGGIPPYPSAGALYPCHPILAQPVGAQLAQLSYVNGATRVIERVDTVDGRALAALVFEEWAWPVSCLLMVVVDLSRITMQYGERGIRFALLEAGTIVERVRAGAESAGLDSCLVGGYHDQDLLRLLGLDPRWFGVAILLAMGSAESAEPGGTP